MRRPTVFFLLAILVAVGAVILQHSGLLILGNIRPNLALIVLAVFSFFILDLAPYLLLLFCVSLFIRFSPGFHWETAALTLIGLGYFYLSRKFFSSGLVACLGFIVLGTLAFYLLTAPAFVYHETVIVIGEILFNATGALLLYALTIVSYEKKDRAAIR